MTLSTSCEAAEAYASLAPYYDVLTKDYPYEVWLDALEQLAIAHGLKGRRLFDVACGTGKSFMPLLERGYDVAACDISEAMLAVARDRLGDQVELFAADVRALPVCGPFDLVTWLDDAANYLLEDEDLELALTSIGQTMALGGLLVFDANALVSHRRQFSSAYVIEDDGLFLCWHGEGLDEELPGLPGRASLEVFERNETEAWNRQRSVHRQRWWSRKDIAQAADAGGLKLLAIVGQKKGAILDTAEPDEGQHHKIIYVLRRSA